MSLKTIKVNPIFLSGQGSSFSPKNKTRKEKPTGVSLSQSNSIKKKLIARIKNFQQNKDPNGNVQSAGAVEPTTDAFSDSLQFLDNLARDKDEKKRERKNTTLKNKPVQNPYMHIATELPPELDWNTIMPKVQAFMQPKQPPIAPQAIAQPMQAIAQEPIMQPWQAAPQPSYGNLKTGGTKPTYRTWLRTTQKQKPVVKPTLNILEDVAEPSVEAEKEEEKTHSITIDTKDDAFEPVLPTELAPAALVPAEMPASLVPAELAPSLSHALALPTAPPYVPSLNPKRKRITRTLKYKLGKHANGKVSVLIKNSQTRRKVQTEQALLKQKSILDIKNHLRSNNLLKAGSNAPSDVLRHLYEQSILAGQVENKAKETLIHNYFNDEKK
jgi:hypothetical protein